MIRVSELVIPPRLPSRSVSGTLTVRSCPWCMKAVPRGMRWLTTARAVSTPLRLTASTQSLSVEDAEAAGQVHHVEVLLVHGVDRPLVVGGQVAHADPTRLVLADRALAEQGGHVQRGAEHRQRLPHLQHPVVVEV